MHNPKIKAYLDRAEEVADSRIKTAIARYAVSRERNVAELARMAYANIADYTVAVGPERVINLQAATRDHLAAVQEITVEDYKEGRGENTRHLISRSALRTFRAEATARWQDAVATA